ncbi:GTP cyclohydrolase I [Priestia megaterium]|nr:hypothetical protein [Priestia megaterium]NGY90002.1 hypothetical protein [Priestia megaterium]QSF35819.1 GTP cyclohydrolase I [Priestia megaterium]
MKLFYTLFVADHPHYIKSVYLPFLQEILLVSILLNSMCTHHLLPFLKYLSIFYFLYFSLKGT